MGVTLILQFRHSRSLGGGGGGEISSAVGEQVGERNYKEKTIPSEYFIKLIRIDDKQEDKKIFSSIKSKMGYKTQCSW